MKRRASSTRRMDAPNRHNGQTYGSAENNGPSTLQGMKMQDMKMQDMKLQDMTRIDSILFNFSFFSRIVMLTLQNVIIKLIEKKDPSIHVTSMRVELSEQVTTQTILICNINNETIKICSSCKQFYTD